MKVGMVSEHASPLAALGGADAGGQNVHVAELAAALTRRGHDVVVYTRRDAAELPERVRTPSGVVVEHLDAGPATPLPKDALPPYIPTLAAELARRLHDDPPAVLHAHFWMSGLASVAAAPAAPGAPVVQSFHALGIVKRRYQGAADSSPVNRVRCERDLANQVSRVIASSRTERRELIRMGADPGRVDIVPSGVDLSLFTPNGPGAPRDTPHRVVAVSRLVPRKGLDDAIRAIAQLPEAELLIAGGPEGNAFDEDEEVRRLRAVIVEAGVGERVRLLGSVPHDELAPLLRSADAVVCLPWYEPFGIVPLEAMACGVPIVAAAVGGLLDTVIDGTTGLHVPARDPDAAAAALRRLFGDERLRARLGRGGVERAAAYSWDAIADRVERVYLEAAYGRSRAHRAEVAG
jgi:glycosyltransferase involved in cell wall biosynthesis